jgi:ADP-heptose:LPS heptosyltransferase
MNDEFNKIILSRTDNLGDVILTLPMAGYLKKHFPRAKIGFIGKAYTRPLIEASKFIDEFYDQAQLLSQPDLLKEAQADAIIFVFPDYEIARLAYQAAIPLRIATGHRWLSWRYCNKLVNFSRRKSDSHESQLNFKLLKPLQIPTDVSLNEMHQWYGLENIQALPDSWQVRLDSEKFKLIVHPKSKGSAREWGLENYKALIDSLPQDKFQIFVTGVAEEGQLIKQSLPAFFDKAIDLTGQLNLSELMAFIQQCDGMLAGSTGPLHIAAALGKNTIGLYPPIRPMHPGRWQPIGEKADFLVKDNICNDCRKSQYCQCLLDISVNQVKEKLLNLIK